MEAGAETTVDTAKPLQTLKKEIRKRRRYAVIILASEQSLCKRRETDDAAAVVCRYLEVILLCLRVEHGASVL